MKKILLSACVLCAGILTANAQLIKNDFMAGIAVGENIEQFTYPSTTQGAANAIQADQWNLTGKTGNRAGASPVAVAPVTYPGYIESGLSNAIQFARLESGDRFSVYSLKDNNDYNEGTYYVAFMATVEEVGSTNGADFLMLDGNYTANNQRAKIFLKNGSESSKFAFGISDDASTPNVSTGDNNKGDTFLLVLKYDFSDSQNAIQLFVNPDTNAAEPTATIKMALTTDPNGSSKPLTSIRGLSIRQRTTTKLQIGGIRMAQTWEDAIGINGNSVETNAGDKGEIVSVKYYNISGVEISEPAQNSGLYIQKNTYANGKVETVKGLR